MRKHRLKNLALRDFSRAVIDSKGIVRSLPINLEEKGWDINSTPYDKDFGMRKLREKSKETDKPL
jgi:hypothetical protein